MTQMSGVLDWFWRQWHKGQIARRIAFFWAIWQTSWVVNAIMKHLADKPWNADTAFVIAAVLTPVLGLTGFIIRQYAVYPYKDVLVENHKEITTPHAHGKKLFSTRSK